jgi:DNA-binding protein YbaB
MYELEIRDVPAVNAEALDEALRAALGDGVSGLSYGGGVVTVHLTGKASPDAAETARSIVASHDPTQLTPAQQQAQQEAAKLDAARKANQGDLDTSQYTDPLLAGLAQKVAWLEQEVIALRAGR